MFLGIACGIFFGEKVAFLQVIGDGFIKLLQMTILPYIVVSLILDLGGLTFEEAKLMAKKAGLLLLFWAIAFAIILLVPLSFPVWESAAFFSTSLVETPQKVDFLSLYIPSNPFFSMANNIVPAVVLFTILLGVAIMGIKKKEVFLQGLATLSEALIKVTGFIVKLTPLGVFAISAAAAGTLTIEQFGRLQVYLVGFDIDMAHSLAKAFDWNLEFIPVDDANIAEQLKKGVYDIAMAGIAMTSERLQRMTFSAPYLNTTAALIVEDFRKDEFDTIDKIRKLENLIVAVPRDFHLRGGVKKVFPNAQIVVIDTPRAFLEKTIPNLDAMLSTAEGGSAWTLLYPKFQTVVIKPETHKILYAYPIAGSDPAFVNLIDKWLYLIKNSPEFQRKFDYWIMGMGAEEINPRWSIMRNVLGWGVDKDEKEPPPSAITE